jgi:hypothetical protein
VVSTIPFRRVDHRELTRRPDLDDYQIERSVS